MGDNYILLNEEQQMQQQEDFENFFNSLTNLIQFCEEKSDHPTPGDIECCQERLHYAVQCLEFIEFHLTDTLVLLQDIRALLSCMQKISQEWNNRELVHSVPSDPSPIVGEVHNLNGSSGPGRPSFTIDIEKVLYLFSFGFKFIHIARCFLIHRTTLWRKLKQMNITLVKFTDISDENLALEINDVYTNHPHCGVSMMHGHLRARGIFVAKRRVQKALREIDPSNSILRWGLIARRRKYSVPGPNSLWHIDGHHALIRWRLVTHGGIDGFSRLIVFLSCSGNNRADTVLKLFLESTETYGVPSRVRGDHGCENGLVAQFMEDRRGYNRGSYIGGRSVHNSRIERLWRDVYYGVVQTFYSLFYYLESIGSLDVNNETDLFCLHFVFMPRINVALHEFKEAYNQHGIRTERGWSPYRMWINGMINIERQTSTAVNEVMNVGNTETFGIEPDEVHNIYAREQDNILHVPEVGLQLETDEQTEYVLTNLRSHCNPLDHSQDYGINIFLTTRHVLHTLLSDIAAQ